MSQFELRLVKPWPEAPKAEAEPYVLPIRGTIEERYQRWRNTDDGRTVYAVFCRRALRERDIGTRAVWEDTRKELRITADNSFMAPMVREAEAAIPELRGRFHKRQRKAS